MSRFKKVTLILLVLTGLAGCETRSKLVAKNVYSHSPSQLTHECKNSIQSVEIRQLAKNSSLAIAIGYMDLVATLGGITLNQTGREIETMLLVMGIYLIISLSISVAMNWYNSSVKLVDR